MPALSMALTAALGGRGEMTPELMCEWQVKRPAEYRAHKECSIKAALSGLVDVMEPAIMSTYHGTLQPTK